MYIEIPKTAISPKPYQYDCRFNSLHELLKYHGAEILPSDLWLISDAYTTCYGRISIPELELEGIPYLLDSENGVAETVFRKLQISWTEEKLTGCAEDEKRLRAILAEYGPVLVRADERAHMENPNGHETLNIRNTAIPVLLGFSADGKEVVVFWTNTNEQEPVHTFPKERFNRFRGSRSLPYPPGNKCIYIDRPETAAGADLSRLDMMKEESLRNALGKMRKSPECDPYLKQVFHTEQFYTGLQALDRMVDDFCHIAGKAAGPHFDREYDAYAAFVFALAKNSLHYGSVSAYRQELAAALTAYGGSIKCGEIEKSGFELNNVAGEWRQILTIFCRLQSGVRGRKRDLVRLIRLLQNIREKEHRIYGDLAELL